MKLQVTQENLAKALTSVARVANTRGTLPILANVLIKTVNNQLSIAATNLDIAITHYCGAKISDEGSITIPARLAQDFISSLPSGVIDLELDSNKLHIAMGQYTSTINGIAADDFPVLPAIENGTEITINGPTLKRALQRLVFAASNDEARPVLTGIYMHISKTNFVWRRRTVIVFRRLSCRRCLKAVFRCLCQLARCRMCCVLSMTTTTL